VVADADGDALTYAYQWTKDGADIPGATSATLDLSVAGNGDRADAIFAAPEEISGFIKHEC